MIFSILKILLERKELSNKENKIHFLTTLWHTNKQHIRKGVYESLDGVFYLNEKTQRNLAVNIRERWRWSIRSKERIKELKLEDKVKVYIDVPQSEKIKFYLKSDLYIQPSWCEGFGNAVLEAMALGVPALVSDILLNLKWLVILVI